MLFLLFCYIHVNLMCTLLACKASEVVGDEHHLSVSKDGGEGSLTKDNPSPKNRECVEEARVLYREHCLKPRFY